MYAELLWKGTEAPSLTVGKFLTRLRRGEINTAYTVRDVELLLKDHVLDLHDEVDLEHFTR